MSDFVIIPDTSCDLSKELRERFGIKDYLKGIIYYPDGHSESLDLDWKKMTDDEYYTSMKGRKVLYKTAAVPMGEIEEVFEKNLKEGKDILAISLSSGLSSSYNENVLTAKKLLKKYPERKILCVDSLRYSTALALIVILACQKRDVGASIEETFEYIEKAKNTVHQMGMMDDLFFLVKTGRLSNFKAFFGTLVGVNPMAEFNHKGLSQVLTKAKGKKAAIEMTLRYIEKTIVDPENQIVFVAHSLRKQYAEILAQKIKERFKVKEVIINPVGMACGASIGPGLCAAFYQGKPISEDLKEEKAIMAQIESEVKALDKKALK